jgi:hypothetical protein
MNPAALSWPEYYPAWHEFYLMAGTAAVTLAGLLFVALSLHIDALIHDTREHLLQLARINLFSFLAVLLLSLAMLVPALPMRVASVQMMMLGALFLLITRRQLRWRPKVDHAGFTTLQMRRRAIIPMIGYTLMFLTGLLLVTLKEPTIMNLGIGSVGMLLGNALGASWDLLVRVARIKHEDAKQES